MTFEWAVWWKDSVSSNMAGDLMTWLGKETNWLMESNGGGFT